MKEYIDVSIEEKWIKQDYFYTFMSDIEKPPSPNEKNLALQQWNDFIDVYNNFFDKYYGLCIKELLLLSISGTPLTASTFSRWYLGVPDPDKI